MTWIISQLPIFPVYDNNECLNSVSSAVHQQRLWQSSVSLKEIAHANELSQKDLCLAETVNQSAGLLWVEGIFWYLTGIYLFLHILHTSPAHCVLASAPLVWPAVYHPGDCTHQQMALIHSGLRGIIREKPEGRTLILHPYITTLVPILHYSIYYIMQFIILIIIHYSDLNVQMILINKQPVVFTNWPDKLMLWWWHYLSCDFKQKLLVHMTSSSRRKNPEKVSFQGYPFEM